MEENYNDKSSYLKLFDGVQLETGRTLIRLMDECSIEKITFREHEKDILIRELHSGSAVVFSAFSKDKRDFIGYVEFKNLDTKPELGIELTDVYQHNGYGYELCREIIRYIFSVSDFSCITYKCFYDNVASQKLAEKLGAVKVGELNLFQMAADRFPGKEEVIEAINELLDIPTKYDIIVYEILKSEADSDHIQSPE